MSDQNIKIFWLIRHAPVLNPDDLCYGQADIPATFDSPAVQARLVELAHLLPDEADWRASRLSRAFLTAVNIAGLRSDNPQIVEEDAFIEQSFGDWQTRKRQADLVHDPDFRNYIKNFASAYPPNGESITDMFNRVSPRLDEIAADPAGAADQVIIWHGGPQRVAVAKATDKPIGDCIRGQKIQYLDGIKIQYDGKNGLWLPGYERF